MQDIIKLVLENQREAIKVLQKKGGVMSFIGESLDEFETMEDIADYVYHNVDVQAHNLPCIILPYGDNELQELYVLKVSLQEPCGIRGAYIKFIGYSEYDTDGNTIAMWCDCPECLYNSENYIYEHIIKHKDEVSEDDIVLRVCFRSEMVVRGKTIKDAMRAFNDADIFTEDSGASFIEVTSVENAETFEDIPNWDD